MHNEEVQEEMHVAGNTLEQQYTCKIEEEVEGYCENGG
jgi:hypothetical protein